MRDVGKQYYIYHQGPFNQVIADSFCQCWIEIGWLLPKLCKAVRMHLYGLVQVLAIIELGEPSICQRRHMGSVDSASLHLGIHIRGFLFS